jgi:hypothetical protein
LPVGALLVLWDNASEMVGLCPNCGEESYGYSFCGQLSVGGVIGACSGCHRQLWRPFGVLGTVAPVIGGHLKATHYFIRSGSLGGVFPGDGLELLAELRQRR